MIATWAGKNDDNILGLYHLKGYRICHVFVCIGKVSASGDLCLMGGIFNGRAVDKAGRKRGAFRPHRASQSSGSISSLVAGVKTYLHEVGVVSGTSLRSQGRSDGGSG
jgi:hypothetical protein